MMTCSSERRLLLSSARSGLGLASFCACILLLQLTPVVRADQVKADNGANLNGTYSWVSGIVPGPDDLAVFTNNFTKNRYVSLGGDVSWKGIVYLNATYTITIQDIANTNTAPHTLTLGVAGIDMSQAGVNLNFGVVAPGQGPQIVLGASQTWNIGGGCTLREDGPIFGTGVDLTKAGEGILLLRTNNFWTGNTFIKEGIIRAGQPSGSGGIDRLPRWTVLTLGDGVSNTCGTFDLHGHDQTLAGLMSAGAGLANEVENSSTTACTLTLSNAADFSYRACLGADSANLFAFVKEGPGTFTLANPNGPNTYSGDTTIGEGTLRLGAAEQIPSGPDAGNLTVIGTLDLNGYRQTVNGLTGSGIIDNVAGGGASTLIAGENDVSSTNTVSIRSTGGRVNVVKTGAGILALNGASPYNGVTMVASGTLSLLPTSIRGGGSVLVSDGATLALTAEGGGTMTNSALTLGTASGATLRFDFGSSGNPTAPLINATNVTISGTLNTTIVGGGLTTGQFTLVKYDTLSGSGLFAAPSLPPGVAGSIINTGHSIDLLITASSTAHITLDKSQTYQTFWGIGASACGPSSTLKNYPAALRSEILDRLFLNTGTNAGFSMVRMGIKETLSPSPGVWDWSKDSAQQWFAQQALSLGCTQFIAVPWSPPAWMKTTNSAVGGELSTNYYDVFPAYLYGWTVQYSTTYGLPIKCVSVQNEPDIDFVSYACCGYTAAEMNTVAGKVADYFQAHNSPVLIGAPECSGVKGSLNMLNKMASTNVAKLGFLPTHNYGTPSLNLTAFGKPTLCTEVCNRANDSSLSEALYWASAIYTNLSEGAVGYMYWWLVNNDLNDPRKGLIDLWTTNHTYTTPKRFFIFAHYSRALRPGDICIGATTTDSGVQVVAAKDPANALAKLVVVNPGDFDVAGVVSGLGSNSLLSIYRTSPAEDFQPQPTAVAEAGSFSCVFPARSVTTLLESFQQPLVWDANPDGRGTRDGGGVWDTNGLNWWSGSTDLAWNNACPLPAVFGSSNGAAGTVNLGNDVTAGGLTFHAAGSGSYNLSGGAANNRLTLTGAPLLKVDANCTATISARLSGAGFQKMGGGTLILAGADDYGGPTLVSGGTLEVSGSISNASYVDVTNAAALDLAGGTITTRSIHIRPAALLSGCGTINADLVNDGTVLGGCGPGSSLAFTGTVTNNGTMRFSGGAALSAAGLFVNNGTLDLITGDTNLPPNLINHGVILGAQNVRISRISWADSVLQVQVPGYSGHLYQLQRSDSLAPPAWTNVGAAQPGNNGLLTLPDSDSTNEAQYFYRVVVIQ